MAGAYEALLKSRGWQPQLAVPVSRRHSLNEAELAEAVEHLNRLAEFAGLVSSGGGARVFRLRAGVPLFLSVGTIHCVTNLQVRCSY